MGDSVQKGPLGLPLPSQLCLQAASSGSLEVGCKKGPHTCPEPSLGFLWQDPASVPSRAVEGPPALPGVRGLQASKQGREAQSARGLWEEQQEGLKVDFRVDFQTSGEFSGHVCQGGSGHTLAWGCLRKGGLDGLMGLRRWSEEGRAGGQKRAWTEVLEKRAFWSEDGQEQNSPHVQSPYFMPGTIPST